jgi:hypothetical protein
MAFGSTHPLTDMSTRNLPDSKWRPVRKADNFTAAYEPIVRPFLFAYPFLFNFIPPEVLVYNSSYTQSIIYT